MKKCSNVKNNLWDDKVWRREKIWMQKWWIAFSTILSSTWQFSLKSAFVETREIIVDNGINLNIC